MSYDSYGTNMLTNAEKRVLAMMDSFDVIDNEIQYSYIIRNSNDFYKMMDKLYKNRDYAYIYSRNSTINIFTNGLDIDMNKYVTNKHTKKLFRII